MSTTYIPVNLTITPPPTTTTGVYWNAPGFVGYSQPVWTFPIPWNVACPVCKVGIGANCKRSKPWKRKRSDKNLWPRTDDNIPHQSRVDQAKITLVEEALDGEQI